MTLKHAHLPRGPTALLHPAGTKVVYFRLDLFKLEDRYQCVSYITMHTSLMISITACHTYNCDDALQ